MVRAQKHRLVTLAVAAILTAMFVIELTSTLQESQIIDEAVHISAGVSYWRTGDFRMNPEHPPLLKLLYTIPLAVAGVPVPTDHPTWQIWNEWEFGDYFLYHSTASVPTLLLLARIPVMLVSIVLGWLIFRASAELFGRRGGLFSLIVYATDPNVIAHSRYVTTDSGFAALMFLSIYRLGKLLQQPTRRNAVWFAAAFTAAGLAKFSGMALVLTIVLSLAVVKAHRPQHPALRPRTMLRFSLLALGSAALVTWAMYGFDVRRPSDDPRIRQLYAQREELLQRRPTESLPPLERFVVQKLGDRQEQLGRNLETLSQYPIPGYAFFRGFFAVIGHSIGGQEAYLLGSYRDTGWWYYFPIAFIAKTPLPTVVAVAATILIGIASIQKKRESLVGWAAIARSFDTRIVLYGSVATVFFAISMASNLNLGWRHIMPVYPFLFVLVGILATMRSTRVRWLGTFVPAALALSGILTQAAVYPNEMGYFSPIIGGSTRGPRILLDSNLDWGQDLPKLARYVQKHNIQSLPFAYYGRAVPSYYVPEATGLPTVKDVANGGEPSGTVAISIGQLLRPDRAYQWLWKYRPAAVVGSSIYVYQLPQGQR